MITLDDLHVQRESTALRLGYWCEAVAMQRGRVWWLAYYPASSPRLAMRWLRTRLERLAVQLDDPAARDARRWLYDPRAYEGALDLLRTGEMCVQGVYDEEDDTAYLVSARPTGHPTAWRRA